MRRGEIRYADLGGSFGRRPVLILTASQIIPVLNAVTCAPITTTIREIATRVSLDERDGLREKSEAACEAIMTLSKSDIDPAAIGSIEELRLGEVDHAVARALDVRRENLPAR